MTHKSYYVLVRYVSVKYKTRKYRSIVDKLTVTVDSALHRHAVTKMLNSLNFDYSVFNFLLDYDSYSNSFIHFISSDVA